MDGNRRTDIRGGTSGLFHRQGNQGKRRSKSSLHCIRPVSVSRTKRQAAGSGTRPGSAISPASVPGRGIRVGLAVRRVRSDQGRRHLHSLSVVFQRGDISPFPWVAGPCREQVLERSSHHLLKEPVPPVILDDRQPQPGPGPGAIASRPDLRADGETLRGAPLRGATPPGHPRGTAAAA